MKRQDRTANLWDAVTEKFGQEPVLIEKLREESHDRHTYRIHWKADQPSTVIGVGWVDYEPKWIQEAQLPRKGGNILGEETTIVRQAPPRNPAVVKAYNDGEYTDKKGQHWRRGMDGWFLDISPTSTLLARHDDFVALIIKENPEIPGTVWNEPLR